MPQLPEDWRVAIEQASVGNASAVGLPTSVDVGVHSSSPPHDATLNEPVSGAVSLGILSVSVIDPH